MTAEAAHCRETLALEQAMKTEPELRRKWLEEQTAFNFDDESLEEADLGLEEVEAQRLTRCPASFSDSPVSGLSA